MPISKIAKYAAFASLFLIPVFPLIVANSFFFPFITGKAFYFRILVEILFASWVILAFLDAKYRPRLTPLTVGISAFALIALVADLLGVTPMRSLWSNFERMEGWVTIAHLWGFYIAAASLFGHGEEGRRLWHRWLNVSLGVALLVSLYGFGQLVGVFAIHQSASRVDSTLGNAAYMAVYMLISAGFAAYLYFVAKNKEITNHGFLRWYYPILAVFFSFILFETATRGAIIGLIGGIVLALILYAVFGKRESKRSRAICGGIIIFIIVLAGIFYAERKSSLISNNPVLGRLASISLSEFKTEGRSFIWPMALKGASERPVLGWGQENFNYLFNANYNPAMYGQEQWFDRAHSVYLDWLVAGGVVGLLAYLSLYVLALLTIWKSGLSVAKKSVLTGLLAGYAVHNIFVFDNLASYVLFFAFLGLADSFSKKTAAKGFAKPVREDVVEYVVAPIAVVLLIAALYGLNVRPIQANTRLIAALGSCNRADADPATFERALAVNAYVGNQEAREQLLTCAGNVIRNEQVPGPLKQQYYALAMEAMNAQIAATPKDARIYSLAGTFLTQIGQMSQAEPLLKKAHELSPQKQVIDFELATVYLNSGENNKALALMKAAYESAPGYDQAKTAYATALVIAGRETEARKLFHDDPAIFGTVKMAQVYMFLKQYSKALPIFEEQVTTNPSSTEAYAGLAEAQSAAGMNVAAVMTLRKLEKLRPELKDQIEAYIKQIK